MRNLNKIGVLSLSAALLLAACGTNGTTDTTEMTPTAPTTEENTDPGDEGVTEPAENEESTTDSDSTDNTEGANGTTSDPAQQSDQGIENRDFEITLEDAVRIFEETFPDAEAIDQVEFDVDDGRYEYEIDGFSATMEYELTIDADTGEVYDQSEEQDDDSDDAIDFAAIISPQEAMANALNEVGSGYVREWQLDTDDGRPYYDIDIEDATAEEDDVEVDAISGDVRFD